MVSDNVKAGLLTLFLGSFGDLASRIIWFNCSIDRAWTMLFGIPPFSLISALMYFFKKIEKASLPCMSAFDFSLIIIPILTILLAYMLPKMIENDMISNVVFIISVCVLFVVTRMINSLKMCKVHFEERNIGPAGKHILRALLYSVVINGAILGFNYLAPYGAMIPKIGIGFRLWGYLNFVPGLQHAIPLTLMHFIMNLYDNVPNKLENLCLTE
jgi:hypothetical protein